MQPCSCRRLLGAAVAALIALSIATARAAEPAYAVRLDVPDALRPLLEENLRIVRRVKEGLDRRRFERLANRSEREIRELLATEGYFSPRVEFTIERGERQWTARYAIAPGAASHISAVEIAFRGALAEERWDNAARRAALRKGWPLRPGARFRQAQWDAGKSGLLRPLLDVRYPLASIAESEARVDPEARTVRLRVLIDSGPAVTLGALRISGLERYPESIVRDLNPIEPGTPFSQKALTELQRDLLQTTYFASAFVTAELDAARPDNVPILVSVVEAPRRRVRAGIGYSTDIGFKAETVYAQRAFFDTPWEWTSGLRLAQREQGAFSEVLTPRDAGGHRYGVGALLLRNDIQGEVTTSFTALLRRLTPGRDSESEIGLAPTYEEKKIGDLTRNDLKALPVYGSWTWRDVDDLVDPRKGWMLSLQGAAAVEGLLTDESFVRGHVKAAGFLPVGARDAIIARAELGRTWASEPRQVPSRYLFRTGGSTTVRGYAYDSLGVDIGGAVTGGRVLGVASVEYVHMFTAEYGVAAFVDAGDAADSSRAFELKLGYGLGARYRSPIGPISLDIAYGRDVRDYRVHFAVGYAF
ncbi:MAG: autotransporter assembly complex family protein [Burkholderiales bacterium]|nr:autotransporter assembly complex family protein [Burkholderiales bacterium]